MARTKLTLAQIRLAGPNYRAAIDAMVNKLGDHDDALDALEAGASIADPAFTGTVSVTGTGVTKLKFIDTASNGWGYVRWYKDTSTNTWSMGAPFNVGDNAFTIYDNGNNTARILLRPAGRSVINLGEPGAARGIQDDGAGTLEFWANNGAKMTLTSSAFTVNCPLAHTGTTAGFFSATPAAKPTGVAVTAAGIHAALVTLGLIAA